MIRFSKLKSIFYSARVTLQERQSESVIIVSTKFSIPLYTDRKLRYHILANMK